MTETIILALALAFCAWREHAHDIERRTLLQRIQAPQLAVAQTMADTATNEPARHVPLDDDEAFWKTLEERGVIVGGGDNVDH